MTARERRHPPPHPPEKHPFLPTLLQLQKKPKNCYNPILVGKIFSAVEPTIWHLGDSPKYEWPIHGAQWSRLAMALPPHPPTTPPSRRRRHTQNNIRRSSLGTLPLKSTKWGVGGGGVEELEAVPETLKELSLCEMQVLGTSGSDFGDNGQIIQRFVRFSGVGGSVQ